jgi:hypothetical protein
MFAKTNAKIYLNDLLYAIIITIWNIAKHMANVKMGFGLYGTIFVMYSRNHMSIQ